VHQRTCVGFSTITERPAQFPPTVGLIVKGAQPQQLAEGTEIAAYGRV
jgi:hypothetical protein